MAHPLITAPRYGCILAAAGLIACFPGALQAEACDEDAGIAVQVLGSGGPEVGDGRASSSYLVLQDAKARLLIDAGGGSALRFEQSGADFNDLDAVLFTHFHVDHSADLPVFIKGAFFSGRHRDLPVFGPSGNALVPDTTAFLTALFDEDDSAYPYLSDYLTRDQSEYRIRPRVVDAGSPASHRYRIGEGWSVQAVGVHHGPIPALALRVEGRGCAIVISGDTSNRDGNLADFAEGADLFIAHHAAPEGAAGVARNLHMPPSEIGRIAGAAQVKELILSHRMQRTIGHEEETLAVIRRFYQGPVSFAKDGDKYHPGPTPARGLP